MAEGKKKFSFSFKGSSRVNMDNRYLFAVILLIVFILEAFVVKDALSVVWSIANQTSSLIPSKGVRVNFSDYQQVVDHIQAADSFKPSAGSIKNPFTPTATPPPASASGTNPTNSGGVLQLP